MSKDDAGWTGFFVPETTKNKLDVVYSETPFHNLTLHIEPYGHDRHIVLKECYDMTSSQRSHEIMRIDESDGIHLMAMLMEIYPENARAIIEKRKRDSA